MIDRLSGYIAQAARLELPPEVVAKAKHHVLDTFAAMLSGFELLPGRLASAYAQRQGGTAEAQVVGSGFLTNVTTAALVNGMLAHADETDDSHAPSLTHPGCAIVPAALVMADKVDASGEAFLKAVVLGYDVCTRTNLTIGVEVLDRTQRSTYSLSGAFGAMAAAASLAGLDAKAVRYALSYTAQQASGLASWRRDEEHVEKAFVFAGMPARNGVAAVDMVQAGFTGVPDVFAGPTHFLGAFSPEADPQTWVDGLGERFEILRTNIKRWPVGSPIQAAVDSLLALMREHGFGVDDVARVVCRLPEAGAQTVDDRHMPDINLQHILAVTLLDGGLAFVASQDYGRMADPQVLAVKRRVELIADPMLNGTDPPRQGIVEVETVGGERWEHRTYAVRGTLDNPMSDAEVKAKAADLLVPLMGEGRSRALADAVWSLPDRSSMQALRPLLKL